MSEFTGWGEKSKSKFCITITLKSGVFAHVNAPPPHTHNKKNNRAQWYKHHRVTGVPVGRTDGRRDNNC